MKRIVLPFIFFTTLFANDTYEKGDYFDLDIASKVIQQSFFSIPDEMYNMATTPFQYPLESMAYLGLIGGLVAVDKPVTRFYQEHIEEPLDIYGLPTIVYDSPFTRGADSWLVFGTMGHYLAGFALGDEKSQVTSIMAMKAITYSYAISHVLLKALTGRNRPMNDLNTCTDTIDPSHTCDPYDFDPFQPIKFRSEQERTAMPSFHLTMYFSVAKVYQEMYDNYWAPYTALAVIFMSDIKGHRHWVSDMVAGGILGTFIGHEVVSSYGTKKTKTGFSIVPMPNGLALSYVY